MSTYPVEQENSYYNEPVRNFALPNHSQSRAQYYNLENVAKPQNFSCQVCNRSFFSHGQYKKHIDEHVECPFPECKLRANIKIIDQHITHQHMLVNFEALQIDDEAWIAERKKRFPTRERAEFRRAEQIERIKRGERLGKDKRKFGQNKTTKGNTLTKYTRSTNCENKNQSKEAKETSKYKKFEETVISIADPYDSDSEYKWGVPAFKGTKAFYESTGEVSLFGLRTTESSIDEYSDIDISDEEDWSRPSEVVQNKKETLQNALGSLIGAYDSESDSELDIQKEKTLSVNLTEIKMGINALNILNEVKEEAELTVTIETDSYNKNGSFSKKKRKHYNSSNKNKKKFENAENSLAIKKSKVNGPKSFKPKPRRLTLLQRLLESDITHERNVILQCIRYVAENNYFGFGSSTRTE